MGKRDQNVKQRQRDTREESAIVPPNRLVPMIALLALTLVAAAVVAYAVSQNSNEPKVAVQSKDVANDDTKKEASLPTIKRPVSDVNPTPDAPPPGMVFIPGGEFTMGIEVPADAGRGPVGAGGSESVWPEEGPPHRVRVKPFFLDATEVTNAQFREFVEATGYKTVAERAPTVEEIMKQAPPGTPPPDPSVLVPGSLVFTPPKHAVPLNDFSRWWSWTPGANWQHPTGPGSNIAGMDDYPVVHVCWDDAVAYAKWAGKRLPTEAEWEFAARGGLIDKPYTWGDTKPDDKHIFANVWQGKFPHQNSKADKFEGAAPVKSFPPNGYGLYDMAGNTWEWCADWYDAELYKRRAGQGVIDNPQGPDRCYVPHDPYSLQRVQRGGSFLCSDEYCRRYRPSARHGGSIDSGMSHVGFRCAKSVE